MQPVPRHDPGELAVYISANGRYDLRIVGLLANPLWRKVLAAM